VRGAGWALLLLVAPALAPAAAAQQPFPYRLSAGRDAVLLGGGAAALAAGVVITAELDVLTPEDVAAADPASVNGFDRPATRRWSPGASNLSDAALVASVGAPLTLLAIAPTSSTTTLGVMLGETILLTNGIGQVVKTAVRRVRPYVYNDDPDVPFEKKASKSARQSFPSGHAANAFASAVFFNVVFGALRPDSPARPWIWVGSLAAAGTVSGLRYAAGKHFPTDILAGAALGSAIGWVVPRLHRSDAVRLTIAPGPDETLLGVSLRF